MTDPSLSATVQASNVPPRVQLTLHNLYYSLGVYITRIAPDGSETPVRGVYPAPVVGGEGLFYDYEPPFGGVSFSYGARALNELAAPTAPTLSTSHTVPVYTPWLIHPGYPDRSMPVTIAGRADRTRPVSRGVHTILNRSTPITITDRSRKAPSFDLTIRTYSVAEETAMETILADSSALLLQTVYPDSPRAVYEWLSFGDVTESDLVPWHGNEARLWTLPAQVTTAPTGPLVPQRTVADVAAEFATVAALAAHYATVRAVVIGP